MFEKQFDLRYFEMNKQGEASPTTMLALLEEAAADHCVSIGQSLYDLMALNIGWVLLSGFMQMERYPKYKEHITIKTWLSEYTAIRGIRENILYDAAGNIIGRAKGLWLFFDIEKRRPAKIFDTIREKWSFFPQESVVHNITQKIEPIYAAQHQTEFNIHRYDTDTNGHVNNLRYLQWLLETIPNEIIDSYDLYAIDGRFVGEAYFGQNIVSLCEPVAGNMPTFIHTIKNRDSADICATATTTWKKRT